MKTVVLFSKAALVAAAVTGLGAEARAQVQVDVSVTLPTIRFTKPPPLVVVSPGIQVVPDLDHEVFFVGNWYWVRHGRGWYRSKDYKGGWVLVVDKDLHPGLVKLKPGKFKRFKHPGRGHDKHDNHPGGGHGKGKGRGKH